MPKSGEVKRSEQKDLTVPQDTSLMPWDDVTEDTAGQGKPAMLKICYSGTRNAPVGCQNGEFFNTATGEHASGWDNLIWINSKATCAWFHTPFDPDKPLNCGSNDGILPSGHELHAQSQPGPCRVKKDGHWIDSCPKLIWGPNNEKPACSAGYNILFWDMAIEMPVIMQVKSSGIKSFEKMKGFFSYKWETLKDKDNPDIPANLRFRINLNTEERDKPALHWVPIFTPQVATPIDVAYSRDLLAKLNAMVADFKARSVDDITETSDKTGDGEIPF